MDALSWHTLAPTALTLAKAPILMAGLWREWDGLVALYATPPVLTWVRGFRLSMIGLALAGSGAGWLLGQTRRIVLSLAIGGEETLESSIMHSALTGGRNLRITLGL